MGISWEVEHFRATTFIIGGLDATALPNLWHNFVGDVPEEVVTRPMEGVTRQTGELDGRQLHVSVQPGRVDWILRPLPTTLDQLVQRPPTLGPWSSQMESFDRVVGDWLRIGPAVSRLAFGTTLTLGVPDAKSGYEELSRLLPGVQLDPTNSSDFLYHINRPRESRSGLSIRINRLSKWSVITLGSISVSVGPSAAPTLAGGPTQHACRLELDINTATEASYQIPDNRLGELFQELVSLGCEIADRGDVR